MRWLTIAVAALAAGAPIACAAQEPPLPDGLAIERVVLLMRHGVRPPTKAPPLPAGTASAAWPDWPVAPGYLTPHGAVAVRLVADYDRAAWLAQGVLPRSGCAHVRIVADSDERTIATAEAYAGALAPGCRVGIEHRPQDVSDPRFSPIDDGAAPLDPAVARDAALAAAGPGGVAGEERRLAPLLARLDAILCAPAASGCGVARLPSSLAPPQPGKRPKLTGALDRASTASQILLLEYAEGKPMAEVGWGRAGAADVARLSEFHAAEFRLLARPLPIARANSALLAPLIAEALGAADAPPVTMISGHDTNVASLGGLLGLHWQVPGLARDDPSPGGALVFERLRARDGRHYVRALYRSQTLDQIRALTPPDRGAPYVALLPLPGCTALGQPGYCEEAAFLARLAR